MPGGFDSEFNSLYAIACSTAEMASAAGGIGQNSGFVTEDDLVNAIACNLSQTVLGLSGDPCNYGWTDTDGAWLAILFYSGQLTGITGTELNAGSTASLEGILYGIACDLDQVATNTGQAAGGVGAGTYLDQLNAIACISAQIADNGFAPPDPVQAFIDAINAFSPRILLVGDRAATTAQWDDQSGNGFNFIQPVVGKRPAVTTGLQNGKTGYTFSFAAATCLYCPYPTNTDGTSIVVFRGQAHGGGSNLPRISTQSTSAAMTADASGDSPIWQAQDNDNVNLDFYNGGLSQVPQSNNAYILNSSSNRSTGAGTGSYMKSFGGTASSPTGSNVQVANPASYMCLGGLNAGAGTYLNGNILFKAHWDIPHTEAELDAIMAPIAAYYGL